MMKMKNLNGTSREGAGVNYKEGVKLLDIESSDSDSQEHFSLPPLELKGARKKKTKMKSAGSSSGSGGGSGGGGGSCGSCCCRTLSVFLLVVALLSTAVIGYFTYRLQAEVRELKDKLAKVESWSQDNPNEFHNLHSNVQDINKDIKEIKTKTAVQLLNITDIFKQIGQLNASTLSLKNSLAQAPELQTLPHDVNQVQQQLIKIGSDLETLKTNTKEMDGFQSYKDSITEQLTAITTRLVTLETKPSDDSAEPSATSRDVISLQNTLRGLIDQLNFTLTTKLNKMGADRESRVAQFLSLRNRTVSLVNHMDELDSRVANVVDPSQTRNIISEEINKLNVTSGNIDSTALQDLRSRVIDIAQEVASLKPQQIATSENVANLTRRVNTLSTQMENDMQVMTESMGDVKVTDLKTRLDGHEVRLAKLEGAQTPGGAPVSQPTVPPPTGETVKPADEAPRDKVTEPLNSNPAKEESTATPIRDENHDMANSGRSVQVSETTTTKVTDGQTGFNAAPDGKLTESTVQGGLLQPVTHRSQHKPADHPNTESSRGRYDADRLTGLYTDPGSDGPPAQHVSPLYPSEEPLRSPYQREEPLGESGDDLEKSASRDADHRTKANHRKGFRNRQFGVNNKQRDSQIWPSAPSDSHNQPSAPSDSYNQPSAPSDSHIQPSAPSDSHNQPNAPSDSYNQPSAPSGFHNQPSAPRGFHNQPDYTARSGAGDDYPKHGWRQGYRAQKPYQPVAQDQEHQDTQDGWSPTPLPLPTKSPENLDTQAPPDDGLTPSQDTQPSGGAAPQQAPQQLPQQQQTGTDQGSDRSARGSRRTSAEEEDPMDSLISALEKETHQ